jgi:hypothetical protein
MRELISRITVSASGRFTDPLKCTLLAGTHASSSGLAHHARKSTAHLGTLLDARPMQASKRGATIRMTPISISIRVAARF